MNRSIKQDHRYEEGAEGPANAGLAKRNLTDARHPAYGAAPQAGEYSQIDQLSSWGKLNRVVVRGRPKTLVNGTLGTRQGDLRGSNLRRRDSE